MLDQLKERFGADILAADSAHGEETIVIARAGALGLMRALRDEDAFAFDFLADLTAVDWPARAPRFDVVYHLHSLKRCHRLRVKIATGEPDASVASVAELWKSADWLERECYDMFGIRFQGHPDLRRILMYDSFDGHPLRKDYPVGRRQPIVPETDPILNPLRPSR